MPQDIPGIHHVTAIAHDPQQNVDFYTDVLGLRFVKKTVNHDDITTYHLYYGDQVGHPGTSLTFFPWSHVRSGEDGTGQAETVAFLVPPDSINYWEDRLVSKDIEYEKIVDRFEDTALRFQDPDGLNLEVVGHPDTPAGSPWTGGPIPEEHAIRGFHSVTLLLDTHDKTADLLEDMGFTHQEHEEKRRRYRSNGDIGFIVDILTAPNKPNGQSGAGTVHHVAFRTENEKTQREWRKHLANNGFGVTNVIDRWYFHSIYFPEPGGVLFEIATEEPGFTRDEDEDELGTQLVLPPWLEEKREMIESELPELYGPEEHG